MTSYRDCLNPSGRFSGNNVDIQSNGHLFFFLPKVFTNDALDSVSGDSLPDLFGDGDTNARS